MQILVSWSVVFLLLRVSQTKIGFVVFAYCRAFVIVIEDISLFIVWNLINEPKDLDDLTLTSMLSSEIIITLHFSIGYHPTHNKKRQWWSSQLLTRGTYAGVIENLFWWHQFVEILKTLSLRKNRGQTVVQSKQGSSSLPRKETN